MKYQMIEPWLDSPSFPLLNKSVPFLPTTADFECLLLFLFNKPPKSSHIFGLLGDCWWKEL